jgi:hypothetical protein
MAKARAKASDQANARQIRLSTTHATTLFLKDLNTYKNDDWNDLSNQLIP